MIAAYCDEDGMTIMGIDGYVHVDGRLTVYNQINAVREHRERFKKHFPHKYESMTHVMFVYSIRDLPDNSGKRSVPTRYAL